MKIFDKKMTDKENECIFNYIVDKSDGTFTLKDFKDLLEEYNISLTEDDIRSS